MARGPREGTDTRDARVRDESEEDRVVRSPGQADRMDLGSLQIGGNFPADDLRENRVRQLEHRPASVWLGGRLGLIMQSRQLV